jgi:hypothetical protein
MFTRLKYRLLLKLSKWAERQAKQLLKKEAARPKVAQGYERRDIRRVVELD